MKVNRLILDLAAFKLEQDSKKRHKHDVIEEKYQKYRNIPYLSDDNIKHMYDVYVSDENERKNICIIDIHGGAYMFGSKNNNYNFGMHFVKRGFDFVSVDYMPNKRKRETKDMISDCLLSIKHLYEHRKDYGIENDIFAITGDSAGGHMALLISELLENNELATSLNLPICDLKPICTLVNCPAYDYSTLGEGIMSDSARRRMFGKNISEEYMKKFSPKTYIDDFKLPLFLSSCKNDFIGFESQKLDEDMKKKDNFYKYCFIDSDNPGVDHVHNVSKPNLEESKQVNDEMISFILDVVNRK